MTQTRQPEGIPTGGQYAAAQHLEPGIVLTASGARFVNTDDLFDRELEAAAGGAPITDSYPSTRAKARAALVNTRGEKDGAVRFVHLENHNAPDGQVDVVGPRDGRPIVISVEDALPSLNVYSGKAVVLANSRWGNSITVKAGAEAVIIAPLENKTTVMVEDGGKATIVCESENHNFRPHISGTGTIDQAFGTDPERRPWAKPDYTRTLETVGTR
jgi:hypothetical protein